MDGAEEGARRLFILSAGNVVPNHLQKDHLDRSDLEAVHDPAHAWNALTVGGYTEKSSINDPALSCWTPMAAPRWNFPGRNNGFRYFSRQMADHT